MNRLLKSKIPSLILLRKNIKKKKFELLPRNFTLNLLNV